MLTIIPTRDDFIRQFKEVEDRRFVSIGTGKLISIEVMFVEMLVDVTKVL